MQNTLVEREDDDEESEEVGLSIGEKVFIATYAQIEELKIIGSPEGLFVDSLLNIFINDRLDSEVFVFKLENLSPALFDLYIK